MVEVRERDPITILVADDRVYIRNLVRARLASHSEYSILDAADGREALELVKLHRPNVILTDWLMPEIDGPGLCREVRGMELPDYVYIILLTAKEEQDDIVSGFEAGADDYIVKPFNKSELLARVNTGVRIVREQRALRQLNELKNRFLGMAAHDLRNPLISIREFSNVLLGGDVGELDDPQKDILKMIHSASLGMLDLVNDLLDVSVIESGKLTLGIRSASLARVLKNQIRNAKVHADAKKIKLHVYLEEVPDGYFDSNRIAQVIDNLVGNAIKFSPPGSNIFVTLVRDGHLFRVSVRDEGPGVSEADRAKMFGEFQRLSARPTGGEKSTGLGLAIVKKIVEAHGGTIEVHSREGEGATFTFSLPRNLSLKKAPKRAGAKARVILAVPDADRRILLQTVLSSMNTDVIAEPLTGEEAIETFRREKPHLMLLDTDLPGCSADKALDDIMSDFKNAFVIMLTSNAREEDARKFLDLGAAGCLEKDAGISEIKRVILKASAKFRKDRETGDA